MSLTKHEWAMIEYALSGVNGSVELRLNEHRITLQRTHVKDRLVIVAFIDGYIKGVWNEHSFPVVTKVWFKGSKQVYSAKAKEVWIKCYGSHKKALTAGLNLDEKIIWYDPIFISFSSLKHQYSKIAELELCHVN